MFVNLMMSMFKKIISGIAILLCQFICLAQTEDSNAIKKSEAEKSLELTEKIRSNICLDWKVMKGALHHVVLAFR